MQHDRPMKRIDTTIEIGAAPAQVWAVLTDFGGSGARRAITNAETVRWLCSVAAGCSWVTSVCTGAFLLVGTGLTHGRRVTTHHDFIADLRHLGGAEL
jgi:transcriptional regulator GlxA family with amidase domain